MCRRKKEGLKRESNQSFLNSLSIIEIIIIINHHHLTTITTIINQIISTKQLILQNQNAKYVIN